MLNTESSTLAHQLPQNKYQDTARWTKLVYFTIKFTRLLKFRRVTEQTEDWAYILYHASYVTLAAVDVYFKQRKGNSESSRNKTTPKTQLCLMNSTETTFEECQAFQTTLFPK